MSEELKCPSCGHGRVLHDLFRGCMQFNCSCTRNKEQVDTLLLISERNALRLQLESVNNENAYLHEPAINPTWGEYTKVGRCIMINERDALLFCKMAWWVVLWVLIPFLLYRPLAALATFIFVTVRGMP